jgi:hypothetical protein
MVIERDLNEITKVGPWFGVRVDLVRLLSIIEEAIGSPDEPQSSQRKRDAARAREQGFSEASLTRILEQESPPWQTGIVIYEKSGARVTGDLDDLLDDVRSSDIDSLTLTYPEGYGVAESVSIRFSRFSGAELTVRGANRLRVRAISAVVRDELKKSVPWWSPVLRLPWMILTFLPLLLVSILVSNGITRHLQQPSIWLEATISITCNAVFSSMGYLLTSIRVCPRFEILSDGASPRAWVYMKAVCGLIGTSLISAVIGLSVS